MTPEEKDRLFAGIKVGGGERGYHLAVLREDGRVTDLARFLLAEEVLAYLSNISPVAIATDGLPALTGDERGKRSERLRRLLKKNFPGPKLLETFSTALHERLLVEDVILPLSLLQGKKSGSHKKDLLDAVLCATMARRHILSPVVSSGSGDASVPIVLPGERPGPIVLPADPFREYTLCIVLKGKRILLGMKKRGLGTGYWNGFGGKIETGESRFEAAARELEEEAGIQVAESDLKPAGLLHFTFADETPPMRGYVFRVDQFRGEPAETEEMNPRWFAQDSIPYGQMWPDDVFWLPLLLGGRSFVASFQMGGDHSVAQRSLICGPLPSGQFGSHRGKRRRPPLSM